MSNQKFCHHCGKQVPIGGNFCASCGTNLSSLSSTPSNSHPARATFAPQIVNADDDDIQDIDLMTHLNIRQNTLQLDIIRDRPVGESMAAVIAQGVGGQQNNDEFVRHQPYKNVDPKQVIADFAKEAGPIRPGNSHTIGVK